MQDQERATEEQRKKEQEDLHGENQGQIHIWDNPENHTSTSSNILTGGHLAMVVLGMVPFTPSKQNEVACLEDVYFDPKRKSIVWKNEKTLKMGTQSGITTVIEKTTMKNVE